MEPKTTSSFVPAAKRKAKAAEKASGFLSATSSSNLKIIRTGSADLDALLGGGYVVGSVVLIL